MVQLQATPFVPETVDIEEEIPIHMCIKFVNDSDISKFFNNIPTEFEWYSYLMIDDHVVAIEPTDSDGCPDSRNDKIDTRIPIKFKHTFNSDGEHDITIGIQIINKSFRFHLVLFETQTKVYGPFTT